VRVKRGKGVQDALDLLVDGSEDAARQLINLVRYGQVVFTSPSTGSPSTSSGTGPSASSPSASVRLSAHAEVSGGSSGTGERRVDAEVREVLAAAKEVLDRVSELTAAKQQVTHALNADQFHVLMQQAQQKAKTLEELAEQWEP
jgi:delta 1-pyrroline-5-carboxylate dehydrogenase